MIVAKIVAGNGGNTKRYGSKGTLWCKPCNIKWNVQVDVLWFVEFIWNTHRCSEYSKNVHRNIPIISWTTMDPYGKFDLILLFGLILFFNLFFHILIFLMDLRYFETNKRDSKCLHCWLRVFLGCQSGWGSICLGSNRGERATMVFSSASQLTLCRITAMVDPLACLPIPNSWCQDHQSAPAFHVTNRLNARNSTQSRIRDLGIKQK